MNKEQMRIAIAEAEGFKRIGMIESHPFLMGELPPCRGWIQIPDYPNDLNAMHDVEKTLTIKHYAAYEMALCKEVDESGKDSDIWHHVLCSTAEQRAKAFLKTIDKWKTE